jgi:excisionase family DNA binding protein
MHDPAFECQRLTSNHICVSLALVNERLMTVSEVAAFLQIPEATLYQWRYRGIGPRAFRVGRHLRYRPEDVRVWLEALDAGAA